MLRASGAPLRSTMSPRGGISASADVARDGGLRPEREQRQLADHHQHAEAEQQRQDHQAAPGRRRQAPDGHRPCDPCRAGGATTTINGAPASRAAPASAGHRSSTRSIRHLIHRGDHRARSAFFISLRSSPSCCATLLPAAAGAGPGCGDGAACTGVGRRRHRCDGLGRRRAGRHHQCGDPECRRGWSRLGQRRLARQILRRAPARPAPARRRSNARAAPRLARVWNSVSSPRMSRLRLDDREPSSRSASPVRRRRAN